MTNFLIKRRVLLVALPIILMWPALSFSCDVCYAGEYKCQQTYDAGDNCSKQGMQSWDCKCSDPPAHCCDSNGCSHSVSCTGCEYSNGEAVLTGCTY